MWQAFTDWFWSLGPHYGVNPLIFGAIYVGAIPFFLASITWLVRNKKAGKSIVLPIMAAGTCFTSAYIYLAIAGRGIPVWVWGVLGLMIIYGIWSAVQSVRKKLADETAA